MGLERATSAKGAEWVEEALRKGDWTKVSSVVPAHFESYAAVLHPAWRCVSTEENVGKYAGRQLNRLIPGRVISGYGAR